MKILECQIIRLGLQTMENYPTLQLRQRGGIEKEQGKGDAKPGYEYEGAWTDGDIFANRTKEVSSVVIKWHERQRGLS